MASTGTLGSFHSLYRYLRYRESGFDITTPKIGGLEFTWPDFHYLLTSGDRTSAAMRSPGVALG